MALNLMITGLGDHRGAGHDRGVHPDPGRREGNQERTCVHTRLAGVPVVVVAVVVLATGGKPPQPGTAPSAAALVVKVALGTLILFVLLAAASHGLPLQAAGLDGEAGPPVAVGRRRARGLPAALGAGGSRRGDDRASGTLHRGDYLTPLAARECDGRC